MKKTRKGSGRTEWLALRLNAKLVREWNPFVDRAVSEGVFGSDQITPRLRVEEAIRLAIAFCSGFYEREMQRRVWARIDRRVRYHVAEEVLRGARPGRAPWSCRGFGERRNIRHDRGRRRRVKVGS